MTAKLRVLIVFGTRPEAIKMAPVVQALQSCDDVDVVVCSTGQHREMLKPVVKLFKIPVHRDLEVMVPGQDLNALFAHTVLRIGELYKDIRPDRILVHGDTTTASASSLAAFHQRIPVGHVEAGLRTLRMDEPWPEELNRRLVDLVADQLYAPTEASAENLAAERLGPKRIVVTGNTVIDALLQVTKLIECGGRLRAALDRRYQYLNRNKKLLLITGHRRENFGDGFENICRSIATLGRRHDVQVIYPVHLNPNVQKPVRHLLQDISSVFLIDPIGYLDFVYLMQRAYLILSDSGGVQEEAPSLGKRVLVMRNVTERPEAVRAGTVEMVGTDRNIIVSRACQYLDSPELLEATSGIQNPYGDGRAAQRIVHEILRVS
jgi:UDP-N-acetylglucosamine 2-epimerase (non-hydrolysing)